MADFSEEFYYEYPNDYEPGEFSEPKVKALEALRRDQTSDIKSWKTDLMATLTEKYMPAEEVYEQKEILRKLKYRIDDPEDDSSYSKQELEEERDLLEKTFDAGRARAKEWIDDDMAEEEKRRLLAPFHILESTKDYEPKASANLLEGYEALSGTPDMPDAAVDRAEALHRLLFQINRLDEDEDLADMKAPFEIRQNPGEGVLSPEDAQLIAKDAEHKKELNHLFAKKVELEDEFVRLADSFLEDATLWEDENTTLSEDDWDTIEELRTEILNDQAEREGFVA
ncbi:MAG: hypothetical protein K5696_06295 [Lachnospiraceae bacterium]|nr:hypothetical protein [Lachnospiraceae bacterium]